jgi:hypothetical protein
MINDFLLCAAQGLRRGREYLSRPREDLIQKGHSASGGEDDGRTVAAVCSWGSVMVLLAWSGNPFRTAAPGLRVPVGRPAQARPVSKPPVALLRFIKAAIGISGILAQ